MENALPRKLAPERVEGVRRGEDVRSRFLLPFVRANEEID
jgi:hypothetical protein